MGIVLCILIGLIGLIVGELSNIVVFRFIKKKELNYINFSRVMTIILNAFLFFYAARIERSGSFSILIFQLAFITILLILAKIDWKIYRLPDIFTFSLLGIGIISAFEVNSGAESIKIAFVLAGFFGLIALICPKGMGLGDVKLIAALGAFLGFEKVILAIFIASISGSIIGVVIAIVKQQSLKRQIPFGPFLATGAIISLFWGEMLISYYFALF